jgi:hypothetical protein
VDTENREVQNNLVLMVIAPGSVLLTAPLELLFLDQTLQELMSMLKIMGGSATRGRGRRASRCSRGDFAKFDQITNLKLIGEIHMAAGKLFAGDLPPVMHTIHALEFALDALSSLE